MSLQCITEEEELIDKRVILRLDLNVPIEDGKILNDFRIKAILPTLEYLFNKKAKILIISHIGSDGTKTLMPVHEYLKERFPIFFVDDVLSETTKEAVNAMNDGDIIMFENIRKYEGEKNNDDDLAKKIAELGDIYVNDAFSASHREHMSIVGLPKYLPSFIGLLFKDEVYHMNCSLKPEHPFVFIIGGAKFATKMPLIKKFLDLADTVFVGGALINPVFKSKGHEVGKSLLPVNELDLTEIINAKRLMLPTDIVVVSADDPKAGFFVKSVDSVKTNEIIVDVGPKSIEKLAQLIQDSKFVLWNGPMGNYENGYIDQTEAVARAIAMHGGQSLVGGGDTVASISKYDIGGNNIFLSTGGGAMLDYLAYETLPGIDAITGK